jgi:hypothetical protein
MLWRSEHTLQETGGATDLAEISNAHAAVTRAQVTQADDSHEAAVLGGRRRPWKQARPICLNSPFT